jgi:hypothetical protein
MTCASYASFHELLAHNLANIGGAPVTDELAVLKDRIVDVIRREGFTVFYGAFPSDNLPQLSWNQDLEPDPNAFLQVAKAQGLRVVYLNWVSFTSALIDDNVLRAEEDRALTDTQADWFNNRNARLEEFREYAGQMASVRVGFLLDGLFHFFERHYDWYETFNALLDEEMPET